MKLLKNAIKHLWVWLWLLPIGLYASVLNRLKIEGAENIPAKGGVLLLSNHTSAYETIVLPWAIIKSRPMRFVWAPAKVELFKNPLMGWLISTWGAFPVQRGRAVKATKQIDSLLKTELIMLYPEGTRNKDGKLGQGNRGVGKIIYENRPVVIPVGISGMNKWGYPCFFKKARIRFGEPVQFDDFFSKTDTRQAYTDIIDKVMSRIAVLIEET